ncbi:acyl-[acyl-carrier-protein] thioesterase [Balneola sp. MJW-20]|uniref:acyl-[acyl-carrier-protein] thioesterase n=1 Tax=Gracilimonas aurantiaca TaxID=3234185 RepID=UPI0034672DDE
MDPKNSIYRESFTIRASEVDLNGKATLASLAGLMQEIAGNHASTMNFDITDLHKQDLTWVLHRLDIRIDRYPEWREEIIIETWPNAGDALRAYRDYRIKSTDGEILGVALSYWMIINIKSRRPSRIPREILEIRLGEKDHVLEIKKDRPKPASGSDRHSTFRVRRADLDMNLHVNNARYLEWITETLAEKAATSIKRADIMFMKESGLGDQITSHMVRRPEQNSSHRLLNQDDEIIALAELNY